MNSSSSCSVELVELLLPGFVPLVLVFCQCREIVLTFSVIIPPHLKVSARVYIRFEGFSFIFLLGQSRCLSFFPHRWIGRFYRPVPGSSRRHKSIERYPEPLGKSVHIHRFHSRRAVEQLQIHRRQQRLFRLVTVLAAIKTDWNDFLKSPLKKDQKQHLSTFSTLFTDFTVEALVAREAEARVAANSVFATPFIYTGHRFTCITI